MAVVGSQIPEPKIPATERFSEDYLVTVVGNLGPDLRILDATMTKRRTKWTGKTDNGPRERSP